ncbi:rho guanine nucleotide exchange factor 11-like isoform X3 [Pelobates cultripes]|uniref:Rho guanine nucleotide exchange factor 11-like isoform X3 n=1 Tax=Pelobates cultripes TaxID=61616 RepID=A0AAD1W0D7_PELCU|nr:rho guanine nucleotide exchange factor 11-like isoform X3 [Pelobates cultripes]
MAANILKPKPSKMASLTWSETVGWSVTSRLKPREIKRQEAIHELFVTEESHLRALHVLDSVFYQKLISEALLSPDEVKLVFPNLPQLINIHNSLLESMKQVLVGGLYAKEIGGILLSHFDRASDDIVKETVKFCCNQISALKLIKSKQREDTRFRRFMQNAESDPACSPQLLKDLIKCEMQRVTQYPLLLKNIIKRTESGSEEIGVLHLSLERCRTLLKDVEASMTRFENQRTLPEIKKHLDTTSLRKSKHPAGAECPQASLTWPETVGWNVISRLKPREIKRQEAIHELFVTEESHLRALNVLDSVFYQKLISEALLSPDEVKLVFPNLPQLINIHNSLLESMKQVLVGGLYAKEIGGILLSHFDRASDDIVKETAKFCCNQISALKLIKSKQHEDTRFRRFMQNAESNPACTPQLLKDLIKCEMQRVTQYPLLLENIRIHTEGGSEEIGVLHLCLERCRTILKDVEASMTRCENQRTLPEIKKHLDTTSLRKSKHPAAAECPQASLTWSETVGWNVISQLKLREIKRQEAIHELFVTEESHLRALHVLDSVFYQKLISEALLSPDEVKLVFPNLPQLINIHNSLLESMKQVLVGGLYVKEIGGILLSHFDRASDDIVKETVKFCCNQISALELIKSKKRKDTRFRRFMQNAESDPACTPQLLKDLIKCEMQRVTQYPLLLENIIKRTETESKDIGVLLFCLEQCRTIIKDVEASMTRIENQRTLAKIQKHLDTTSLRKSKHPMASEFADLDLTKKRLIHAGLLTWKRVNHKTTEVQALLLEDLLVLLRKKRNKLVLKWKEEWDPNTKTKKVFSPIIKLNNLLVRTVATDQESFFVMDTSESPQLYKFTTTSTSEKKNWIQMLNEAMKEVIDKIRLGEEEMKDQTPDVPVIGPDSCIEMVEEAVYKMIGKPSVDEEMKDQTPDVSVIAPDSCIEMVEEPVYKMIGEPSGDEEMKDQTPDVSVIPPDSKKEDKIRHYIDCCWNGLCDFLKICW